MVEASVDASVRRCLAGGVEGGQGGPRLLVCRKSVHNWIVRYLQGGLRAEPRRIERQLARARGGCRSVTLEHVPVARPATPRACPMLSLRQSVRRSDKAPGRMASTPTTDP